MMPVAAYFIAEEFHFSGIIAVVFAGIIFNVERHLFQRDALDNQAIVSINYNQETVSYILNGFVFVFLGYLLPEIFKDMESYTELSVQTGLWYVLLITFALIIFRFVFVYVFYVSFQPHTFNTSQKMTEFLKTRQLDVGNYSRFEYSLIASLCGIHGTVTLATALLIPLTLPNGESFPLREVILFIGSGVVLMSMIIGTIFLPIVIKSTEEEQKHQDDIRSKVINEVTTTLINKYSNLETNDDRMGFALTIKKLREQEIFFSSNRRELVNEFQKIISVVTKKENDKSKEILERYDNNRYLRRLLYVRKWRLRKLFVYSIPKQIFITLRLSLLEVRFRRMLVTFNLITYSENDKSPKDMHLYERRIRNNNRFEYYKDTAAKLRQDFPSIVDELTYYAMDMAEEERNKKNGLAVDFAKNIYDYFDYTMYNVPSDAYIEENRKFEAEAISLQKQKIIKLKEEDKINHEYANLLIRDLNYNEALLYDNAE